MTVDPIHIQVLTEESTMALTKIATQLERIANSLEIKQKLSDEELISRVEKMFKALGVENFK